MYGLNPIDLLQYDSNVLDTLYMLCNRDAASQAMANIPYNEQPQREELEDYVSHNKHPSEDFAWGELYPQLVAWLSDREERRRRKEMKE